MGDYIVRLSYNYERRTRSIFERADAVPENVFVFITVYRLCLIESSYYYEYYSPGPSRRGCAARQVGV